MIQQSTGDIIISLQNVGVRYKRRGGFFRKPEYFQAIKNVNFNIHRGETVGIIGRNGAGKSTLLKVIAGIIQPDTGKVISRDVTASLLTLQAGFDPELSGIDNSVISGMLMGYTKQQVESRIGDIAEFSELGSFMKEPVKTYSSGMKARLGFSVAVYMTPDVLLLDEILSVGDKQFKKKAETEMMKKIHSQQTIVLVSHSEGQVKRLCDRVIEMEAQ